MDMKLSTPAIKALELLTGKKLKVKGKNRVVFTFDVFRKKDQKFFYKLSNKLSNELLLEGALTNYTGRKTKTIHKTKFETLWVTFNITTKLNNGKVTGQATFSVLKVPLPMAIDFKKIK